ncbi:hypothetical protein ACFL4P_02405 [Gemmatimonadota bacterium]
MNWLRTPSLWQWLVLIPLLAYYCMAMTVIAPVEGDGIAMSVAAEQMINQGYAFEGSVYFYSFQPGIYAVLLTLSPLLGLDCFTTYSITCVVALLSFIIISSIFTSKITHYPPAVCIILMLLLFPQTYCEGSYPNSTIMAAPFGMLAFLILVSDRLRDVSKLIFAAVFIGVAAFFRFDFALMGFAVFPLLLYRKNFVSSIYGFTIIGVLATTVVFSLHILSGAQLSEILSVDDVGGPLSSRSIQSVFIIFNNITKLIEFFPVATSILLCASLTGLLEKGKRIQLLIVLSGFLPLWLAYVKIMNTPKYFYYSIPFLLIGCLYGIDYILQLNNRARKAFSAIVIGSLVFQLFIGINIELRKRPWRLKRSPKLLQIAEIPFSYGPLDKIGFYLGVGSDLPTSDGPSFPFGSFWGPLAWYNEKSQSAESMNELVKYINSKQGDLLPYLSTTWVGSRTLMLALVKAGYHPVSYSIKKQVWQKGHSTIYHYNSENYNQKVELLLQRSFSGETLSEFIYVTGLPREIYLLENSEYKKGVIHKPDKEDGRFAFYKISCPD